MSAVIALNRPHSKLTAAKVDRLGLLKEYMAPFRVYQIEFDQIKQELVAQFSPEGDPDCELTIKGKKFTLVLSPCSKERSVTDIRALWEQAGTEAFLNMVRPVLTEIDKQLTANQKAGLIHVETGYRRLKAIVDA